MKVLIYANSSETIGIGHSMRCLALSTELREQGHEVVFAYSTCLPAILDRYHEAEFKTVAVAGPEAEIVLPEIIKLTQTITPDWIVIDWYEADSHFQNTLREHSKILVIDDFEEGIFGADLVLNQNTYDAGTLKYSLLNGGQVLNGPKYALIRPEFTKRALAFQRNIKTRAENILISFGGSDETNFTAQTLEHLRQLPLHNLQIRVILGPGFTHLDTIVAIEKSQQLNLQIITNCQNMAEQLEWCDLAILGSGSTFWEACCLSVPTVLVRMISNQNIIFETAQAASAAILIDSCTNLKILKEANLLINLIQDPETREKLSKNAKVLCDGQGALRVGQEMINFTRLSK
jgi:UDP-2,4-diacetamido-2,4,6-trideoxy-beta-L-altropyranose hydrolase